MEPIRLDPQNVSINSLGRPDVQSGTVQGAIPAAQKVIQGESIFNGSINTVRGFEQKHSLLTRVALLITNEIVLKIGSIFGLAASFFFFKEYARQDERAKSTSEVAAPASSVAKTVKSIREWESKGTAHKIASRTVLGTLGLIVLYGLPFVGQLIVYPFFREFVAQAEREKMNKETTPAQIQPAAEPVAEIIVPEIRDLPRHPVMPVEPPVQHPVFMHPVVHPAPAPQPAAVLPAAQPAPAPQPQQQIIVNAMMLPPEPVILPPEPVMPKTTLMSKTILMPTKMPTKTLMMPTSTCPKEAYKIEIITAPAPQMIARIKAPEPMNFDDEADEQTPAPTATSTPVAPTSIPEAPTLDLSILTPAEQKPVKSFIIGAPPAKASKTPVMPLEFQMPKMKHVELPAKGQSSSGLVQKMKQANDSMIQTTINKYIIQDHRDAEAIADSEWGTPITATPEEKVVAPKFAPSYQRTVVDGRKSSVVQLTNAQISLMAPLLKRRRASMFG